jgi:4-methyl-5(b-hydroxyethyl)-thiazole monophosphate biosynthesis
VTVTVAGLEAGPVTASRNVVLLPETTLDAVLDQDFDMVVLPGGLGGAQRLEADQRIAVLLRRMTEQGRFVAAICAAPRVLASAGLLKDREATAYPGILDGQPEIRLSSAAVVRDGL